MVLHYQMSFFTKSKLIKIFAILLLLGFAGYLFFVHTLRGNSWALYLAAGWGAPISVRMQCAEETDQKVYDKFQRPLAFDKKSKNTLKNFWHYSYYRQCLFDNHYDFSGAPIASSNMETAGSENAYINSFAGIGFKLPENSKILSDNVLDVNMDDRLYVSQIQTPAGVLTIKYYQTNSDYNSFDDLNLKLQKIPGTDGAITNKTVVQIPNGTPGLSILQTDNLYGLAFLTPKLNLIIIYGPQKAMEEIKNLENSLVFI